jgi:transcriptional regulator with XRE-family HTH domain
MSKGHRLLKAWRKRARLHQVVVATQLGISQSYICDLERGLGMPSAPLANRIARITRGFVPVAAWGEARARAA